MAGTITVAERGRADGLRRPGARDAIELVTRAVTEWRFALDPALARPERGRTLERFVFRLGCRLSGGRAGGRLVPARGG